MHDTGYMMHDTGYRRQVKRRNPKHETKRGIRVQGAGSKKQGSGDRVQGRKTGRTSRTNGVEPLTLDKREGNVNSPWSPYELWSYEGAWIYQMPVKTDFAIPFALRKQDQLTQIHDGKLTS